MAISNLSDHHYNLLSNDSGISDEIIEARGYYTTKSVTHLKSLGIKNEWCVTPSLIVPGYSTKGVQLGLQARPDQPVEDGPKYITPSGQRSYLDVPNLNWVRDQLRDTSKRMIITEGAKKVDACVSHGQLCVGLPGVWSWKTKSDIGSVSIGCFDDIGLKDRAIWICYDSDIMGKPMVAMAGRRLKELLERRGARVRFVLLPDTGDGKTGLDDYLAGGGSIDSLADCLHEELDAPAEPWHQDYSQSSLVDQVMTRYGNRIIRYRDSNHAHIWTGTYWFYDLHDNELHELVSRQLLETQAVMGAEVGPYKDHETNSLTQEQKTRVMKYRTLTKQVNYQAIRAITRQVVTLSNVGKSTDEHVEALDTINLANGVHSLTNGKFSRHDARLGHTAISPTLYDPHATAPSLDRLLDRIGPDQSRALQQAAGVALCGHIPDKRMTILVGAPNTGKSLFIKVMKELFGTQYGGMLNSDALMSRKMQDGVMMERVTAKMDGKRAIFIDETADMDKLNAKMVKALTGGKAQMSSRKLYQEERDITIRASFFVSTNYFPRAHAADEGLWKRLRLIDFGDRSLESYEIDMGLEAKLVAEASGIYNWAFRGLQDYLTNGEFVPKESAQKLEEHRRDNNPVLRFLEESTVKDADGHVQNSLLHLAYQHWCNSGEEHEALTLTAFTRALKRLGISVTKTHRTRRYTGIRLPDNVEIHPATGELMTVINGQRVDEID